MQEDAPTTLSSQLRADVAWSVGSVMSRLNRLSEALSYLQIAQNSEKARTRRKEISGEIARVKAVLHRQEVNAARQPILHADLEQDRVVRPRLVARAEAPAKPAAQSGEKP